jgi:hypothetical protein
MLLKYKVGIVLFCLLAFVSVSIANEFLTRQDALNHLNQRNRVLLASCEPTGVYEEIVRGGESLSKPYALFTLTYTVNGEVKESFNKVELPAVGLTPAPTEQQAKDAIAGECDRLWAEINKAKERPQNAVVNYGKQALSGLLKQVYSPITKVWSSK